MQKHNRIIILFMLFLMITWYAPMVIKDNIARAYATEYNDFRLDAFRQSSGLTYDSNTSSDGRFLFASTQYGLRIYNTTSHNLLTNDSVSCNDVWVNGNYVFVSHPHGLSAYYFSYISDSIYTFTLLDSMNTSDPATTTSITGNQSYIYTSWYHQAPEYSNLRAYSFDYGGSNTFTWLSIYNVSRDVEYYSITTDGTYIFTAGWQSPNDTCAFSFDGSSFTFIDNHATGDLGWDIYYDPEFDFIYVATRSAGLDVVSFNGVSFSLHVNWDNGDTIEQVTGSSYAIFTDANSPISDLQGKAFSKVTAYSISNIASFTLPLDECPWSYSALGMGAYGTEVYYGGWSYLWFYNVAPYFEPDVTTLPETLVTTSTATVNAEITNNGNWDFTGYGFQYGTTQSASLPHSPSSNVQESFSTPNIQADDTYSDITTDYNGNVFTCSDTNGMFAYQYNNNSGWVYKDSRDDGGTYNSICLGYDTFIFYLFVACGADGLRAYTYNETAGLNLITTIDDGGTYNGVWYNITGDVLFVACGASGVRSYTFNGTGFTLVDTQFDGTQPYLDVCANENGVYTTCGTEGVRAYTYSGGSFTIKDTDYQGAIAYGRIYSDRHSTINLAQPVFFITRGTAGALMYSFNGLALSPIASVDNGTQAYEDVWASGNYLYTACGTDGIRAYLYNNSVFTLRATESDGSSDYVCIWGDNESNIYAGTVADGVMGYYKQNKGAYSLPLTGLNPGTTYYYRAYTNNTHYTGYGSWGTLYTSATGGISLDFNINVYNESNGSQGLIFNIMIKNLNGSQVYSLLNQNNTLHLNTSALTGNQQVLIKVWSLGYRERIVTIPLYDDNITANYTFYLPREEMGAGADPGGGSGFYANSTINPYIYNIRIVETIRTDYSEFDRPIAGAWVNVRRFINSTGNFELMSTLVTDTNGWCNLYLIPSVLYIFDLNATYYDNATSDWNPVPPNPYQMTETKIFRMLRTQYTPPPANFTWIMRNITISFLPLEVKHQGAITFWYNITSSDGQLEYYRMSVEFYNKSNFTWYVINSQNESNASGGSINYTTPNASGAYRIEIWFKRVGYREYQVYQTGSLHYTILYIQQWIKDIPDFVWYLIIVILMIMFMGFCFTVLNTGLLTGYLGLGIFAFGIFMKPDLVVNGFPAWQIWALTFLLYTMGIFLWSKI